MIINIKISHNITYEAGRLLNFTLNRITLIQIIGNSFILKFQSYIDLITDYNVGIDNRVRHQPSLFPKKYSH